MYKLIYKNQFVAGFDEDQVVGNLAQLLQIKPKTIRLAFLSQRPSVIKIVESAADAEQWRTAFLEAGVYLDVVSIDTPDSDDVADQIELELELHSLDDELEDEPPRQLLVKKIIVQDDAEVVENSIPAAPVVPAIPTQIKPTTTPPAVIEAETKPAIETNIVQAKKPARGKKPAQVNEVIAEQKSELEELTVTPAPDIKPDTEIQPTLVESASDDQPEFAAADENEENNVPTDDEHSDVDWHKSSFMWGMLAILLAIVLTASTILWLKRPLWLPATESAHSDKIVNALAVENLFALAHIDVPRLQQLPDVLQPGTGLNSLPAPSENFWQKLEQSGINIAEQLDQVWISAYRSDNQTQSVWVLTGKFNADEFRAWLKNNYTIDEEAPQHIVFSSVDENSCEKNSVMMAAIEPERIVIGAPERVAAFRGRLDAAAPAGRNLSDWQTISAKQILTLALFSPAQFSGSSAAMALGKLSLDVSAINGIYLGVTPRRLPPVLEFDAVMTGANQAFIDNAESTISALLANVTNSVGQDWPETLSIYERMKLSKNNQQLHASVPFDEHLESQLRLWSNSLLAKTFALSDDSAVATEERLEDKPRAFTSLSSPQVADFATTQHLNSAFSAQTTAGPFGLGISSIEATAEGVVITLDVNAFNLPNLGKEADSIQLRILDIVDHQDQSLLTASGCDATGVRRAANINMIYDGAFLDQGQPIPYIGIQGTKKILLPETINLSNIGAIKGELTYNLPVEVERVKVDAPLAGKLVDSQGLQLRFLSAGTSRLYFRASGNSDALLHVNALNADGKILAVTNSMQDANFPALGINASIDVQGVIAAAEVIVASKLEKQTYPFSFGRIQPLEQEFSITKPAPELLTATTLAALKQDSPPADIKYPYQSPQQPIIAGPALIAVNQMDIQAQQLSLVADIYLRNQHPLTRQLSATRFVITEVEDSAGDIHSVNFQAPVAMEYQGGSWVYGVHQPDPEQPWLRGQLDLRAQDLGVSDVVAFWGKLVFLAASDPVAIQLPFQFGMQWNGAESSFKLARWEAGRLLFDIHGSFPELMAITALDDSGAAISQAAELRSSLGVNQVELPIKQRPATIEFSIARNQQTAEFPFEIRAQ